MQSRLLPPPDLHAFDETSPVFVPAPEVIDWARDCFIGDDSTHRNSDHDHLELARLGALWTNAPARRQMRSIAGTCEIPSPRGLPWVKARQEAQLREWFGVELPDFVITLSAPYCATCSDVEFCALVEHELYHAGQARDEFGNPKFSQSTGRPKFALLGHDVEEFVGVVRRYGAAGAGVEEMVEAARQKPEIGAAAIGRLCGTCTLRVA